MLFYVAFYTITALEVVVTNVLRDEREKKILIALWFVGAFIISGTRFELGGTDYYIYRTGYEAIPTLTHLSELRTSVQNINLVNNFELGYLLLNSLVKTLGFSFYGFTLIESAIWYICMYYGLKRYISDWAIVLPVFLYKLFFYNTFISMRQSITIAIFFVSWHLIQEKKMVQYYFLCILGLLFHNGAIILFILYPLLQLKMSKKRLYIYNIICWTIFLLSKVEVSIFSLIQFILNHISLNNTMIIKAKTWIKMSAPINIFHILEYAVLMFLVLYFYEKIVASDKNALFVIKIFTLLLPIFTIFSGNIVSTRFKDYFTITYGIILLYLCKIDDEKRKYVVQIGTVILCAYGFFRYIVNFDSGGMIPYTTYITQNISIFN